MALSLIFKLIKLLIRGDFVARNTHNRKVASKICKIGV